MIQVRTHQIGRESAVSGNVIVAHEVIAIQTRRGELRLITVGTEATAEGLMEVFPDRAEGKMDETKAYFDTSTGKVVVDKEVTYDGARIGTIPTEISSDKATEVLAKAVLDAKTDLGYESSNNQVITEVADLLRRDANGNNFSGKVREWYQSQLAGVTTLEQAREKNLELTDEVLSQLLGEDFSQYRDRVNREKPLTFGLNEQEYQVSYTVTFDRDGQPQRKVAKISLPLDSIQNLDWSNLPEFPGFDVEITVSDSMYASYVGSANRSTENSLDGLRQKIEDRRLSLRWQEFERDLRQKAQEDETPSTVFVSESGEFPELPSEVIWDEKTGKKAYAAYELVGGNHEDGVKTEWRVKWYKSENEAVEAREKTLEAQTQQEEKEHAAITFEADRDTAQSQVQEVEELWNGIDKDELSLYGIETSRFGGNNITSKIQRARQLAGMSGYRAQPKEALELISEIKQSLEEAKTFRDQRTERESQGWRYDVELDVPSGSGSNSYRAELLASDGGVIESTGPQQSRFGRRTSANKTYKEVPPDATEMHLHLHNPAGSLSADPSVDLELRLKTGSASFSDAQLQQAIEQVDQLLTPSTSSSSFGQRPQTIYPKLGLMSRQSLERIVEQAKERFGEASANSEVTIRIGKRRSQLNPEIEVTVVPQSGSYESYELEVGEFSQSDVRTTEELTNLRSYVEANLSGDSVFGVSSLEKMRLNNILSSLNENSSPTEFAVAHRQLLEYAQSKQIEVNAEAYGFQSSETDDEFYDDDEDDYTPPPRSRFGRFGETRQSTFTRQESVVSEPEEPQKIRVDFFREWQEKPVDELVTELQENNDVGTRQLVYGALLAKGSEGMAALIDNRLDAEESSYRRGIPPNFEKAVANMAKGREVQRRSDAQQISSEVDDVISDLHLFEVVRKLDQVPAVREFLEAGEGNIDESGYRRFRNRFISKLRANRDLIPVSTNELSEDLIYEVFEEMTDEDTN